MVRPTRFVCQTAGGRWRLYPPASFEQLFRFSKQPFLRPQTGGRRSRTRQHTSCSAAIACSPKLHGGHRRSRHERAPVIQQLLLVMSDDPEHRLRRLAMLPHVRLDCADRLERLLDVPVARARARIRLKPHQQCVQRLQCPRRLALGSREAAPDRFMPLLVSHVSAGSSKCRPPRLTYVFSSTAAEATRPSSRSVRLQADRRLQRCEWYQNILATPRLRS